MPTCRVEEATGGWFDCCGILYRLERLRFSAYWNCYSRDHRTSGSYLDLSFHAEGKIMLFDYSSMVEAIVNNGCPLPVEFHSGLRTIGELFPCVEVDVRLAIVMEDSIDPDNLSRAAGQLVESGLYLAGAIGHSGAVHQRRLARSKGVMEDDGPDAESRSYHDACLAFLNAHMLMSAAASLSNVTATKSDLAEIALVVIDSIDLTGEDDEVPSPVDPSFVTSRSNNPEAERYRDFARSLVGDYRPGSALDFYLANRPLQDALPSFEADALTAIMIEDPSNVMAHWNAAVALRDAESYVASAIGFVLVAEQSRTNGSAKELPPEAWKSAYFDACQCLVKGGMPMAAAVLLGNVGVEYREGLAEAIIELAHSVESQLGEEE